MGPQVSARSRLDPATGHPGFKAGLHPYDPGGLCHPSTRRSLGHVSHAIRTDRQHEPPKSVLKRRRTIQQWLFRRTELMPKVHVVHICPDPGDPRVSGADVTTGMADVLTHAGRAPR